MMDDDLDLVHTYPILLRFRGETRESAIVLAPDSEFPVPGDGLMMGGRVWKMTEERDPDGLPIFEGVEIPSALPESESS